MNRNNWFSFYPKWGFTLTYDLGSYFDNRHMLHINFIWGNMFIHLPFRSKYDECDPPSYGVYYHENTLVIRKGRTCTFFYMPWHLDWRRTSILRADGKWETEERKRGKDFWNKDKWEGIFWKETHPYNYTLNSGEVQERIATIEVHEIEWRRKWFKWTKLFSFTRRFIDIDFNDEVGERAGSWKGGCMSCSYDMKKGETPAQALERMNKERRFN